MQSSVQTLRKSTLLFWALIFACSTVCKATGNFPDPVQFQNSIDSLFQISEELCKNDSTSKLASSWAMRTRILQRILEDGELKDKYQNLDLHTEILRALNRLKDLDKANAFRNLHETGFANAAMELSNLGMESLDNSRKFNSLADAEKAAEYFSQCLDSYKNTGESQKLVDQFWKEGGINWQWIRFYKAVAFRKAGKKDQAQKEYSILINVGWNEAIVFLELSDLYLKDDKTTDAQKVLIQGMERLPESIPVACALTRLYVNTDQVKKAFEVIKPFDRHLNTHTELVLTKALVYEKKGDFKKADALYKAVYNSDPNEVEINSQYAGYLMRKAVNAHALEAEEFVKTAYHLVRHASELSPGNEALKSELAKIETKYPKVKLALE